MSDELRKVIDAAVAEEAPIITTVEAFHKEPELLYEFLQTAANLDVEVILPAIETTDRTYAPPNGNQKDE